MQNGRLCKEILRDLEMSSSFSTIALEMSKWGGSRFCSEIGDSSDGPRANWRNTKRNFTYGPEVDLSETCFRGHNFPNLSLPVLQIISSNSIQTRLAAAKPYRLRRLIDLNQHLGQDH